MSRINYDNKLFAPVSNSANGEVNAATIFYYHEKPNIVWATYEGGDVVFGTLIAKVDAGGSLDMSYQHFNKGGEIMTGECKSVPEVLSDGRLRLHERWRWTSGNLSEGSSIVEEIESAERNRQ